MEDQEIETSLKEMKNISQRKRNLSQRNRNNSQRNRNLSQRRRNISRRKRNLSQRRETILQVLMRRDNMSEHEAQELIESARSDLYDRLSQGEMPEYICQDWFGLEPDYIDDLLW